MHSILGACFLKGFEIIIISWIIVSKQLELLFLSSNGLKVFNGALNNLVVAYMANVVGMHPAASKCGRGGRGDMFSRRRRRTSIKIKKLNVVGVHTIPEKRSKSSPENMLSGECDFDFNRNMPTSLEMCPYQMSSLVTKSRIPTPKSTASLGHIPSTVAVAHRGVSIPSTACSYCGEASETANHILVNYPFAASVRSWIWKWCGGVHCNPTSINDLLLVLASWGSGPKTRSLFNAICHGLLWSLWKASNERLFNKHIKSPTQVFDEVVFDVRRMFFPPAVTHNSGSNTHTRGESHDTSCAADLLPPALSSSGFHLRHLPLPPPSPSCISVSAIRQRRNLLESAQNHQHNRHLLHRSTNSSYVATARCPIASSASGYVHRHVTE
ncbi:hypothetical protein LXL04_008640 [Taraxacum kok-saghyz]